VGFFVGDVGVVVHQAWILVVAVVRSRHGDGADFQLKWLPVDYERGDLDLEIPNDDGDVLES
jgi:hypothetical protein